MVVLFGAFLLVLFCKEILLQMKRKRDDIWSATPQIYGLGYPLVIVYELGIFFIIIERYQFTHFFFFLHKYISSNP